MNRKEFILAGTAAALMPRALAAEKPCAENDWGVVPDGIRVRFMGTGAADWLTARKEEEIDHAFDAKVKVTSRETGKAVELTVPAGGYSWMRID